MAIIFYSKQLLTMPSCLHCIVTYAHYSDSCQLLWENPLNIITSNNRTFYHLTRLLVLLSPFFSHCFSPTWSMWPWYHSWISLPLYLSVWITMAWARCVCVGSSGSGGNSAPLGQFSLAKKHMLRRWGLGRVEVMEGSQTRPVSKNHSFQLFPLMGLLLSMFL